MGRGIICIYMNESVRYRADASRNHHYFAHTKKCHHPLSPRHKKNRHIGNSAPGLMHEGTARSQSLSPSNKKIRYMLLAVMLQPKTKAHGSHCHSLTQTKAHASHSDNKKRHMPVIVTLQHKKSTCQWGCFAACVYEYM